MIVINNINDEKFSINGIAHFKNFLSKVDLQGTGENVTIYNAYFSKDVLVSWRKYDEFQVAGVVYGSPALLQQALLPVLYTRNSLNGGGSLPSTTPGYEVLYFGGGAYTNTVGNSTSPTEFAAHINSVGFTITSGKLAVINITVKRQIQGQTVMQKEWYFFTKNNVSGTWGTGSSNGEVAFGDFIYIGGKTVTTVTDDTELIELGDIGTDTIYAYINAIDQSTITWENLEDGTDYLFTCVRNGVNETYRYEGALPQEVGAGSGTTLTVADFDLIESEGSSGGSVISTLQQITESGAITDILTTFLNGITVGSSFFAQILLGDFGVISSTPFDPLLINTETNEYQLIKGLEDVRPCDIITNYPSKYNASINFPPLSNTDTGYNGVEIEVGVAGIRNFGDGDIDLKIGDILANNGTIWYKKVDNNQGSNPAPPIDGQYADITALLADQNAQEEDYFYRVDDASDDPNVTSGAAIYIYEGTDDGDLGDYYLAWKAVETQTNDIVTDASVSGTYDIDFSKSAYNLTVTGATTFTFSNLPDSGQTKEMKLFITGDYPLTLPANWSDNLTGEYVGRFLNTFRINYLKASTYETDISIPYGKNILRDGTFEDPANYWTLDGSFSSSGNELNYDGINNSQKANCGYDGTILRIGDNIEISFEISNVGVGETANIAFWGAPNGNPNFDGYNDYTNGKHSFIHTLHQKFSENLYIVALNTGTGGAFTISNIQVRKKI